MYTVGFVNNSEMIITHDDNSRKEKEKKIQPEETVRQQRAFVLFPPTLQQIAVS